MTDAERLDARLEALSDKDLQWIAEDKPIFGLDLRWYRPRHILVRMAKEILKLREELAATRQANATMQAAMEVLYAKLAEAARASEMVEGVRFTERD